MENKPSILIELPVDAFDSGFSAGLPTKSSAEFGEPDGAILAWIASHVRIAKPPRMPN